ncbi:MAG: MEMO1 family protein [Anaerolineaceae bacterium]|nr:AmmeMemoRadiSam system protein B [Anaerolineae bacterium]MDL1926951.1 AmmeMemoRadiSam system protein B [Anaerolineae bacterium AMX1]WKZ53699.1 MAG: AmmeMemoRadiSam system protein B [Anaerolineales bacterium]GIK08934.1 MAG: MEMO1 family protein [Chloroflexota bacterium]GJQ39256.1 MAG: MEMO1 family protein [Anaerolineaceae bacterium]
MTLVNIRPSPIAGTWYEGDPVRLARAVDAYLDAAHVPALDGETVAVIAPHAGHRYSGPVAGYAFAALRGRTFERVAVVSPFHNFDVHPLLVAAHSAYSTPLGEIAVDKESLLELDVILKSELGFGLSPIARDREHSLEIELPFLQRVLTGGFSLIPVMIRGQEPAVARGLGLALAQVLKDKNALLVASTDLSHFYDQQTANRLDAEMLKRFESFQPEKIFEAERTGKGFACGHAAVAAVLHAARELGADRVQVLHYATSGDVTGDFSQVVGYGAAVVLKPATQPPQL